jgi:carboxyl-terminal processing protease
VPGRRRSLIYFPLVILTSSLVGGIYGPSLSSTASAASEDDVQASIRAFTKVYNLVESNFADRVDADRTVYKGAIPGMLRTLDPHSNFFDPRDFKILREDQKGKYFGVGMSVATQKGKTVVIAPFPKSPASRAGIRPGDFIMAVDGKPTDNLTVSEVADLLKGALGTEVQVEIAREGAEKTITFKLIRAAIERNSVSSALWLRPGIAYVDIEHFNENTSSELEKALSTLGESKIEALILDLRANPGGLLTEGVAVADRFLEKNQVVVSHRGRSSTERLYKVRSGSRNGRYPIVVMVNQFSASAAEIVAGALQDHDRAWIIGEQTFGKGLVQTVYPLGESTGLALTTAKYYTPSGRLIQREYQGVSFFDYYNRKKQENGSQDVRMTDSGRTVYGGGGITPDEIFNETKFNPFQIRLLQRRVFLSFASRYLNTGSRNVTPEWNPDHIVMTEFHSYLMKEGVPFTEAEFADVAEWTKSELKKEVFIATFGTEKAQELQVFADPMVAQAINSLPKAKALLENARKVLAQRAAGANQ